MPAADLGVRSAAEPMAPAPVPRGAAVRIAGVSKRFGETTVLDRIDIAIGAGSVLAIVGESGCGKSTLLRLLAGLDAPTAGRIDIDAGAAGVRLMFQDPRLLPWASVRDNVRVGLGADADAPDAAARASAALASVQLSGKAEAWPATLSGGQRQRVALARALVSRPGLLALDEPLGALDALTRLAMQRLIATVHREQGFTMVLVTHDVAEAAALADRAIVLRGGRIALDLPIAAEFPRKTDDPEVVQAQATLLDAILRSQPASG